MQIKDVYNRMKEAGVEIGSHSSDLHVPVTETSTAILEHYEFHENVTKFRSLVDGKMWYDIPFAYQPFWDKVDARVTFRLKEIFNSKLSYTFR